MAATRGQRCDAAAAPRRTCARARSVFVLFIFELVALSVASDVYPLSFFFWTDVLGTVSMVLDIKVKAQRQR